MWEMQTLVAAMTSWVMDCDTEVCETNHFLPLGSLVSVLCHHIRKLAKPVL